MNEIDVNMNDITLEEITEVQWAFEVCHQAWGLKEMLKV